MTDNDIVKRLLQKSGAQLREWLSEAAADNERLRAALRKICELGHDRDLPDAWELARKALKGE